MPEPHAGTGDPRQAWARLCADAVVAAHAAARAASGDGAAGPTATEALTEAVVTATAVRAAVSAPGDATVAAMVARRVAELTLGTMADLLVDVPAWDAGAVLAAARELAAGPGQAAPALDDGLVASVAAVLSTAAFPPARSEDLHEALAQRCVAITAGLPEEWGGPADVLVTGLPLLSRPVADVALAVALARDEQVEDPLVRRFVYRRFAEPAGEGLTERHLVRSRQMLAAFLETRTPSGAGTGARR